MRSTRCVHDLRRLWKPWRLALGLVLLLVIPDRALAQGSSQDLSDLELEDLMQVRVEQVFGAAKRLQPTTEAPSSVTIVTSDDIRRYGYRSLADILRGARGLFVTYDRNYSYLGAGGFARPGDFNTRILVVVDGHRINDDIFDQAGIGMELGLDAATFERVEIIRGPSSALYGTSAFLAVVNVTTKRGRDINGVSVVGEVGTLGATRVHGTAGRTFSNGVDVAVSASVDQTDGQERLYFEAFDTPAENNGVAVGLDADDMRGVTGRLTARDVTVTAAYGWRHKVVPTAAYGAVFNAPGFSSVDRRAFVDVAYEHAADRTRYAFRTFADMYRYDGRYPYASTVDGAAPIISTDYGHGSWWGAEGRVSRELPQGQTLTAGLELRDYAKQDQGESFADDREPAWASHVSTNVFAAYVQDEIRVRDRLLFSVGGRYDAYSGFDRFSPRASAVFAATPSRSFKFLFGSAFRAPNAYELDYLTNGVRNLGLGAETIMTSEIVWEEYVGGWLRTSISAYRNDADHLVSLVSNVDGDLSYTNAGRIRSRGLEFEAETKHRRAQTVASYSWQHAEDHHSSAELTNSPRHLGKVRLSLPGPIAQSVAAVEVLAMSSRLTLAGQMVGANAVVNFNYLQPLGRHLTFTVSARNLFDDAYSDPASEEHRQDTIPQDGRTARVGLEWAWRR